MKRKPQYVDYVSLTVLILGIALMLGVLWPNPERKPRFSPPCSCSPACKCAPKCECPTSPEKP